MNVLDIPCEYMMERGSMLHQRVNTINPLLQYYLSSPKLLYRSGETGLEKRKPIKLLDKHLTEAPAYIVSVSPTYKTKMDT